MRTAKPVVQHIKDITVYEDETVVTSCEALSFKDVDVQWMVLNLKDNSFNELDPEVTKVSFTSYYDHNGVTLYNYVHGRRLELKNVAREDDGEYYCKAKSAYGYDYTMFRLRVLPKTVPTKGKYLCQTFLLSHFYLDSPCLSIYVFIHLHFLS